MTGYIARRAAWAIVVVAAVWLLTFVLLYLIPSDPARVVAGRRASAEDVERIRQALGLDRSLIDQMAVYLERLVRGDLGHSFAFRQPVLELLLTRLPATLELAVAGLAAQLLIGLPLGVAAATRRAGLGERLSLVVSSLAAATPAFWIGPLLILGLASLPLRDAGIDLLPIGGYEPLSLRHLFLPALTLGIAGAAYYARLLRASLLEELGQDYRVTARAKGLSEGQVLGRHVMRNALNPVVTQAGIDMGLLLGGVVVVENVFGWPGIGRVAVDAVGKGDVPVIMGTVIVGTLFVVAANLAADIVNARLDPRLRTGGG
jgi:peptide/nickel transport system permease protein